VKQREAAYIASGGKQAAEAVAASCEDFLRQMGYREYSRYLSFHFPFTHERSLLEHLRACPWRWNQSHFKVRTHGSSCAAARSRHFARRSQHHSWSASSRLQLASCDLKWIALHCENTIACHTSIDVSLPKKNIIINGIFSSF